MRRIWMYLGFVAAGLCVCARRQMMEQSAHHGGRQRHVCEYTTEQQCHLGLETTAHHPQALAWRTFGLEGSPLRLPTAGVVCATETGNKWEKSDMDYRLLPHNGTDWGVRAAVSLIKGKSSLSSQSFYKLCTFEFLSRHPKGWNYTLSPYRASER